LSIEECQVANGPGRHGRPWAFFATKIHEADGNYENNHQKHGKKEEFMTFFGAARTNRTQLPREASKSPRSSGNMNFRAKTNPKLDCFKKRSVQTRLQKDFGLWSNR
jgi:hypothetical protein